MRAMNQVAEPISEPTPFDHATGGRKSYDISIRVRNIAGLLRPNRFLEPAFANLVQAADSFHSVQTS